MDKPDGLLKRDVVAELEWDPAVDARRVGVSVRDGVVSLSGTLDTYMDKHAVERAVRRVAGVRGLALDLQVQLDPDHARTDAEIAQAATQALRWHSLVPRDAVQVQVEDGCITLRGEVDWPYQRSSAEHCVAPLLGVRAVDNQVALRQHADPATMRAQIAAALARHARREAEHIAIEVEAGVVTLRGTVGSLAEHDAVLGTATATRGVTRVIDELRVA